MIGTIIHAHFSDTLQGDKINLCHYTWNMISQLILECRYELCRSTYTQFSVVNITVQHSPWLVELAHARNCRYGGPTINYMWINPCGV